MAAKGIKWARDALMATNKGVIAGYGCVAMREIVTGEKLFSIPRCACLGAHTGQPDGDCQWRIARQVLRRDPEWLPLLNTLTPASCPWLWPQGARTYLQGTELEDVVRTKLQRLSTECTHPKYARACALVLSHVNPWFNTSIVPFSCLLNCGLRPNVKFAQRGQRVIGWALRHISPGSELTQEYALSTAEFVYRYGFTPPSKGLMPDDVVSITLSDLGYTHHCADSTVDSLVKALCLEDNPWDGLNHMLTVELGPSATGTAKLVIVALALPLSMSIDEQDPDVAAASLAATMLGSTKTAELLVIAHANGGEDRDPWPALLRYLSQSLSVKSAIQLAMAALAKRKHRLSSVCPAPPADYRLARFYRVATSLRRTELRIIATANRKLACAMHSAEVSQPVNLC